MSVSFTAYEKEHLYESLFENRTYVNRVGLLLLFATSGVLPQAPDRFYSAERPRTLRESMGGP
jgi:hypothetical protein